MKIPLKYNLRSMWVRRVGTLMTAVGIGLTVAIVIVMMSMVSGLQSAFTGTGQDNQLIVIRQGSLNEVNSYFSREAFQTIRFLPGIARDAQDEPLASPELIVVINWARMGGEKTNLVMRGIPLPVGLDLRPEIEVVEGRLIQAGLREILVSRSVSRRFEGMQLGNTVTISRADWKIVGIFESNGSAYDSEIFAAKEDVAQVWRRTSMYTSILLRATDAQAAQEIQKRVKDDQRINLQAVLQKEYFSAQTDTAGGVRILGYFIGILMGFGACFAAMNMMYGTIMTRVKEIATLRALGFRRRSILSSFMVEAILLSLLGGLLGCLMALPFQGWTTGTANLSSSGSFSEVLFQFRITKEILAVGLLFALTVGVLGGFFPSLRAARLRLIEALRD